MSRFDPSKQHKSAVDWSAVAWKTADQDKSAETFVIGLVAGTALASVTTPLLGGVIGAYFVVKGIQKAQQADKNKRYIRSTGCVAHVLDGGNFRAYLHQVGQEMVVKELEFAESEGLAFSDEAIDFYENYLENLTTNPILQASQETVLQSPTTTVLQPKAQFDYYDPTASAQIDIISEMVQRITNTIVIGIPGSGKGILISNAIRVAKRKHPKIKIFVIDPKADPKEAGYWSGCDVVKSYACMDAKPATVAAWSEAAFDEYAVYAQKNERTLLIVDEGTMLGNKLQQAKSTLLVDKLTSYTSGGDSAGRNVWFIMQSPYVGGASLNLSTTSQMTSIVIAFSENIGAIASWKSAKIFKQLSLDAIAELVENSSTGRAIYYGKTGQWYMMPELTNYSGYNRDKRQYLPGFTPQGNEPITKDVSAISKLEESLSNSNSLQGEAHSEPNSGLSPSAELLLSYFDNVKQRTPKTIADLKDANKLRQLSGSELLKALRELIVAEHLTFDAEGRYFKPDWE